MRLHRNMGIQVVECTIGFLATIPSALVHALNFFIATARTLMLLRTRNGDKGVDLRQRRIESQRVSD